MWTRAELKSNAKKSFSRFYWWAVLTCFIMTLAGGSSSGSSFTYKQEYGEKLKDIFNDERILYFVLTILAGVVIVGIVFAILVRNPFKVGANRVFIKGRKEAVTASEIVYAYDSGSFLNIVKTMLLMDIYTFLWTLLFIIPGIVKAYEYRMIPYILAEKPDTSAEEAFRMSREMMDGQKMDAFILDLSFFGWLILSACTAGIVGIFYVNPYMAATNAELYEVLKENNQG